MILLQAGLDHTLRDPELGGCVVILAVVLSIYASVLVKKGQLVRYVYGLMLTECGGYTDSAGKMVSDLLFLKHICIY